MILVRDVWNPGTLNPTKIRAYKLLADRELIQVQHIRIQHKADITTFEYLASQPETVIHTMLKEAAAEMEGKRNVQDALMDALRARIEKVRETE